MKEHKHPPLLVARGLRKSYGRSVLAVNDVSLSLERGRTLGIVGESGSGKSTTIKLILGLEKRDAGRIYLDGLDFTKRTFAGEAEFRRRIQLVPQNPQTSFNPRMTIGASMHFALAPHIRKRKTRWDRIVELCERVAFQVSNLEKYPHELSGGQLQRAAIARALGPSPEILVCDEAVSALDKSVQAQVLNLLVGLQQEYGLAMLFISHDMTVIEHVSDEVMVLFRGEVVEYGAVEQVTREPEAEYTRLLLDSVLH